MSTEVPNTPALQRGPLTVGRAALGVGVVTAVIYILTMNPSFGFVDKGELVAVASTAGIPHPTGYPTIMLLAYAFTKVMPLRPVVALNVLSALLTAGGAAMLVLLFNDLLQRIPRPRAAAQRGRSTNTKPKARRVAAEAAGTAHVAAIENETTGELPSAARIWIAAFAAMFTAFTATWWNQGNGFEVYSLHALLMPLVTLLFLRFVDEAGRTAAAHDQTEPAASGRRILFATRREFAFALLLGLSFTNHMSTVLLAPAFLVHYFWTLRINARSLGRLLRCTPAFVLGLLPYLWLPIRAGMHPRFNWGDPTTPGALFDHVSGKIYRVYMFDSAEVFRQQAGFFFRNLPAELAYVGIPLAVAGIVLLAMRSAKLSAFVGLLFAACVLYSSNYDIMEIGPYYMTAIFAIGIWCLLGMAWLARAVGGRGAVVAAAVLAASIAVANYSASDESRNLLVEDMTRNVLENLPKNAVIFSSQWDFWVAGSFYMQEVEKLRPDVIVVDPELLRRRWYVDELAYTYPEFMGPVRAECERFKNEVYKFDNDLPYDGAVIQDAYIGMMNAMIDRHIAVRPVFVGGEVDPAVGAAYQRVPNHLALQLTRDTAYVPQTFPSYRFSFWDRRVDSYAAKIYELYARSALARGLYEAQHGDRALALRYIDYALGFDPGFTASSVPDLQLNGEDQVYGMIDFFAQVRATRARLAGN